MMVAQSQVDLVIQIQTYNRYLQEIQITGPMIRSLFIPDDKCKWGCFDYSQQEPRLLHTML